MKTGVVSKLRQQTGVSVDDDNHEEPNIRRLERKVNEISDTLAAVMEKLKLLEPKKKKVLFLEESEPFYMSPAERYGDTRDGAETLDVGESSAFGHQCNQKLQTLDACIRFCGAAAAESKRIVQGCSDPSRHPSLAGCDQFSS